jgi:hypothetical protein
MGKRWRSLLTRCSALGLAAGSLAWSGLLAQTPLILKGKATCEPCRITLALLGETPGSAEPSSLEAIPFSVVLRSSKEVVVFQQEVGRVPMRFGLDGVFRGQVGRIGSGPGEFRFARVGLVDRGDSLHVFDVQNARLSVLSPQLTLVRTASLPFTVDRAVRLSNGQYIVTGTRAMPDGSGFPFHSLDQTGRYERSFGLRLPVVGPRILPIAYAIAANRRRNAIWAVPYHEFEGEYYAVTLFDSVGSELLSIRREDRAIERARRPLYLMSHPPPAMVFGLLEEPTDTLWVYTFVPAPEWKAAYAPPTQTPEGPTTVTIKSLDGLWDTMIDVIDVRHGRLVASTIVSQLVGYPLGRGLVAGWREDEDGTARLQIWRVELNIPPKQRQ